MDTAENPKFGSRISALLREMAGVTRPRRKIAERILLFCRDRILNDPDPENLDNTLTSLFRAAVALRTSVTRSKMA